MNAQKTQEQVVELTDVSFESEVLRPEVPVLVDFFADWCPPCKAIAPTIEALAGEYAGRVKVGKVDTEANPETATCYGVRSIPTLVVFERGKEVKRFVGLTSKKDLAAALDAIASR